MGADVSRPSAHGGPTYRQDPGRVVVHLLDASPAAATAPLLGRALRLLGAGQVEFAVEVHGVLWTYGPCGIRRRRPPVHAAKCQSAQLGVTRHQPEDVRRLAQRLSERFSPAAFDPVQRHGGHFAAALCEGLGVGPAPHWAELPGPAAALAVDAAAAGLLCACYEEASADRATETVFIEQEECVPADILAQVRASLDKRAPLDTTAGAGGRVPGLGFALPALSLQGDGTAPASVREATVSTARAQGEQQKQASDEADGDLEGGEVLSEAFTRLDHWTGNYVATLRSRSATGRPLARVRRPQCSVSRRPAYRLVREHWLQDRRPRSRWSEDMSPRCQNNELLLDALCREQTEEPDDDDEEAGEEEDPHAVVGPDGDSDLPLWQSAGSLSDDAPRSPPDSLMLDDDILVRVVRDGRRDTGVEVRASRSGRRRPFVAAVDAGRPNLEPLQVGDVVLAVNGSAVADVAAYEELTRSATEFILTVQRDEDSCSDLDGVFPYQRHGHPTTERTLSDFHSWLGLYVDSMRYSRRCGSPRGVGTPRRRAAAVASKDEKVTQERLIKVSRWIDVYMDSLKSRRRAEERGERHRRAVPCSGGVAGACGRGAGPRRSPALARPANDPAPEQYTRL